MTPKFFDAHTHLNFSVFESDLEEVIQRARKEGVWLVNVGTQKETSVRAVEITNKEGVYAAVGLHPIHASESFYDRKEMGKSSKKVEPAETFDYDFYKNLAKNKKVVAIGECGLDYFRLNDKKSIIAQKEIFLEQIKLAAEIKKPLMIHCRQAFGDLIQILNSKIDILNSPPGIIHFFSGSLEDAKKLLDLGFYFTFGGVITFSRDYDEIIRFIPLEKILSETDAPYVAPVPYRAQRNEPAYVPEVVKKIAEIKRLDFDKAAEKLVENALKIFDPHT